MLRVVVDIRKRIGALVKRHESTKHMLILCLCDGGENKAVVLSNRKISPTTITHHKGLLFRDRCFVILALEGVSHVVAETLLIHFSPHLLAFQTSSFSILETKHRHLLTLLRAPRCPHYRVVLRIQSTCIGCTLVSIICVLCLRSIIFRLLLFHHLLFSVLLFTTQNSSSSSFKSKYYSALRGLLYFLFQSLANLTLLPPWFVHLCSNFVGIFFIKHSSA